MIGKVIGAFVGDRLAKQTGGIGGASGGGGDPGGGGEPIVTTTLIFCPSKQWPVWLHVK